MARVGQRIVCAAVNLRDGKIVCGVRHFDELMQQVLPPNDNRGRVELAGHVQGFVDNDYQFLNRSDAWRVAIKAHQVDPRSPDYAGTPGTLFSEDLW